jgi:transposase-like protein
MGLQRIVAVVLKVYVNGVSTRKVDRLGFEAALPRSLERRGSGVPCISLGDLA